MGFNQASGAEQQVEIVYGGFKDEVQHPIG